MSNIFVHPLEAAITPELRQWLVLQASAGISPAQTHKAMLDVGWSPEIAQYAVTTVIARFLQDPQSIVANERPRQSATAQPQQSTASAVDMPDVNLQDKPSHIVLGEQTVRVVASLQHPRVVVLANFLSDSECEALVAAAEPRMRRSLTVNTDSAAGDDSLSADRTSDGMFFERGESDLIARIEARIAALLDWPADHGEGLQVLHYLPGAQYKPHHDYFDPNAPSAPALLRRGGQRLGTLLMYLNTPEKGGGTTFPAVGLEVAAQKGYAVFFSYDKPDASTLSLHGGAPVIEGQKWVATKWLREGIFS